MKKTKIILVTFLFLIVSSLSFAKNDNDVPTKEKFGASVQISKEDAVILRCMNNKFNDLRIQFYDSDGELLHEKLICEKCNVKLTYSLKELPHGTYLVKIMSKNKAVYTQKFTRKYGKIFLN